MTAPRRPRPLTKERLEDPQVKAILAELAAAEVETQTRPVAPPHPLDFVRDPSPMALAGPSLTGMATAKAATGMAAAKQLPNPMEMRAGTSLSQVTRAGTTLQQLSDRRRSLLDAVAAGVQLLDMHTEVIVVPPIVRRGKEQDRPRWYLYADEYKECFCGGPQRSNFEVGAVVDFDHAVEAQWDARVRHRQIPGVSGGLPKPGDLELLAEPLENEEEFLHTYENWSPYKVEEWESVTELLPQLREYVYDHVGNIRTVMEVLRAKYGVAAAAIGLTMVGMTVTNIMELDEATILMTADDPAVNGSRVTGPLPAMVDYLVRHYPRSFVRFGSDHNQARVWDDGVAAKNGYFAGSPDELARQIGATLQDIDTDLPPNEVRDIFVFDGLNETYHHRDGCVDLRGKYLVANARYISALAKDTPGRSTMGLTGWRLLDMAPVADRKPVHGYDDDCPCMTCGDRNWGAAC